MSRKIQHEARCEWTGVRAPLPAVPRTADASIGRVLGGLMARLGLEQLVQQRMIAEAWREIVGEEIARHAHPTRIHRGVLTVSVNNSVWLFELSTYQKQTILRQIQERFNPCPVKKIVFVAG
jgi:predicted nucleic acid-binding Zn ribbon protein